MEKVCANLRLRTAKEQNRTAHNSRCRQCHVDSRVDEAEHILVLNCRNSDAEALEFNLSELMKSAEMKSSKKQSVKAGRQLDGGFGAGDMVTVVASRKTDAENKVSVL